MPLLLEAFLNPQKNPGQNWEKHHGGEVWVPVPSLLALCAFFLIPVPREELRHQQMTLKFRL